jgi:hypothetical protein
MTKGPRRRWPRGWCARRSGAHRPPRNWLAQGGTRHSTRALAAIGCYSLGIYILILPSLLPFFVEMAVSPVARLAPRVRPVRVLADPDVTGAIRYVHLTSDDIRLSLRGAAQSLYTSAGFLSYSVTVFLK